VSVRRITNTRGGWISEYPGVGAQPLDFPGLLVAFGAMVPLDFLPDVFYARTSCRLLG
jgi:hypothetical protein